MATIMDRPEPSGRGAGPLDTTVRLVTPERVTFDYPLAGPFKRGIAYGIDVVIWLTIVLIVTAIDQISGSFFIKLTGLTFVLIFALSWGYGAVWEGLANGQTPGKMATGLRVVSGDGTPIGGGQAFLRNLCWFVEGPTTLMFLPALAAMLLTERFQRLGDLAAGTMVVVEKRPGRGRIRLIQEPAVDAVLARLPARLDAGPDLARTLADYIEARDRLSLGQREEMTAPLARPLRERHALPETMRGDAVVAAVYSRVFLGVQP